ncbi:MAG: hypothetical protein QOD93_624 [Acetobacteraceae bacterium]|jgi:hypothetical protein|nr:hypothetical protein [Rhodopila sp.]MEA2732726.1 hypothetical protein [Acetobacteraceae bacterium]MEA2767662.1 hypothetical protein [Acetobacteraceae bacterium]
MNDQPLPKLLATPWEDVLARAALTGECAALVQAHTEPAAAIAGLEAAGFVTEAAKLMAHALPKRECVWWACMCARHTTPPDLPDADAASVAGAEDWVRKQTDESRREAFEHAQHANFGTAEAWAAVAAFWSGDSMSPLGLPKTPPAPHLTGTAAIGSVTLAAVRTYPARRDERLRRFLASGREIAAGGAGRLPTEEVA